VSHPELIHPWSFVGRGQYASNRAIKELHAGLLPNILHLDALLGLRLALLDADLLEIDVRSIEDRALAALDGSLPFEKCGQIHHRGRPEGASRARGGVDSAYESGFRRPGRGEIPVDLGAYVVTCVVDRDGAVVFSWKSDRRHIVLVGSLRLVRGLLLWLRLGLVRFIVGGNASR